MKMKRVLAMLTACSLAAMLTACGGGGQQPADGGEAAAALSGAVTTGGSTSVEKVIGVLSESFMEKNTAVDVSYSPTGSGAGITGASDGTLDLGLSSRALKDEETAKGLTATTFALDGIAIIVNQENPVQDLSLEQIQAWQPAPSATGRKSAATMHPSYSSDVKQVRVPVTVSKALSMSRIPASMNRS